MLRSQNNGFVLFAYSSKKIVTKVEGAAGRGSIWLGL